MFFFPIKNFELLEIGFDWRDIFRSVQFEKRRKSGFFSVDLYELTNSIFGQCNVPFGQGFLWYDKGMCMMSIKILTNL